MSDNKLAKLIFERWAADLKDKDKTFKNVSSNFDELFYELWKGSVPFEAAHDIVREAVAEHLPSQSVAKWTYKNARNNMGKTFQEYLDDWKKDIKSAAHQSFFSFYKLEDESEQKVLEHGNMSEKEYIAQRRYADAFPEVDIIAIKKQRDEMMKLGNMTYEEFEKMVLGLETEDEHE